MAEQLFQIGIKGLIRNQTGHILLVRVRAWKDIPSYWDMPGGRMDPGETFEQTLRRELKEELDFDYTGQPKHVATALSNLKIPVGDMQVALALMAYEVDLPDNTEITLEEGGNEEAFRWFDPVQAAKELHVKYPPDFCEQIAKL